MITFNTFVDERGESHAMTTTFENGVYKMKLLDCMKDMLRPTLRAAREGKEKPPD